MLFSLSRPAFFSSDRKRSTKPGEQIVTVLENNCRVSKAGRHVANLVPRVSHLTAPCSLQISLVLQVAATCRIGYTCIIIYLAQAYCNLQHEW